MLVYNKVSGDILAILPNTQDPHNFFINRPDEFKKNITTIDIQNYPLDLENYKIINNELIKRSQHEIFELRKYRRVLTEEERMFEKLRPSIEEVDKAERTIEVLSLIQEVI